MISDLELQRLRDLPIEGVAQRLGLTVSRHRCLCPFHADKHPSLSFGRARNTYRCFVCGASGGTIDLVMHLQKLGFREACRWLADTQGVILELGERQASATTPRSDRPAAFDPLRYVRFFEHPWLSDRARRFLFDERRLDPRVVSWCRLTSWRDRRGLEWLQIPYFDTEGRLIGVQSRNLSYAKPSPQAAAGDGEPRFRFPAGSRCSIYNLPMLRLLGPGDECWIAEGCSDAWSHMSRQHKAIAIASATLLQPRDEELLREVTTRLGIRWRMAPDADEPGRRLAAQLKALLPELEVVELPPGVKDYSELYVRGIGGDVK